MYKNVQMVTVERSGSPNKEISNNLSVKTDGAKMCVVNNDVVNDFIILNLIDKANDKPLVESSIMATLCVDNTSMKNLWLVISRSKECGVSSSKLLIAELSYNEKIIFNVWQ